MPPSTHGLTSRSSSTALSLAQQLDFPDTATDDVNIAHSLLAKRSKILLQVTSTTDSSITHPDNVPWNGLSDEAGTLGEIHNGRKSRRSAMQTSNTWTSSSGDILSDHEENEDRTAFVEEYNRLAKKHGVRPMVIEENETPGGDANNQSPKAPSWFSRKILRRTSSTQSIKLKPDRAMKHKRSISDLSLRLKAKKDKLKNKDLQELVRLCGSSLLYLPTEYAAGSLAVPTCFRATAQYLVQHATTTRGIFRIPGSHFVVSSLYNHYCTMDDEGEIISGTVRCPTLPDHIRCDVHDVASAFKRFLSGLPGGILGSLPLFDAFISIQSQLQGAPEATRTKQSKIRARLIALAIATLKSQYRRELICAVFGLLCMVGRAAETARREDDRGRPLPTADLMGYGPLGILFGPLLIGDLLEDYTMRLANPHGGLVLLPISPPKSRKEKQKKTKSTEESSQAAFNTYVDKIKIAASITEMLIIHWRDVVRHIRNLNALKVITENRSLAMRGSNQPLLRPSASEPFALRKPRDWDESRPAFGEPDRSSSPTPIRRISGPAQRSSSGELESAGHSDFLTVRKQRSRPSAMTGHRLSRGKSMGFLSPTVEEYHLEDVAAPAIHPERIKKNPQGSSSSDKENIPPSSAPLAMATLSGSRRDQTPFSYKIVESRYSERESSPLSPNSPSTGNENPRLPLGASRRNNNLSNLSEAFDGLSAGQFSFDSSEEPSKHLDSQSKQFQEPLVPSNVKESFVQQLTPQELSDVYELIEGVPLKTPSKNQDPHARLEELKKKYPNTSALIHKIDDHEEPREVFADSISKDISSPTCPEKARGMFDLETHHPRRQIQSDIGPPAIGPIKGTRKFSRSMHDDSKHKKGFKFNPATSFSKDPLSRITLQEDLASLAALAQALDISDEPSELKIETKAKVGQSPVQTPRVNSSKRSRERSATLAKEVPLENRGIPSASVALSDTPHKLRKKNVSEESTKESSEHDGHPFLKDARISLPLTPKRQFEPRKENTIRQSPNAKVSALVAKFSCANSPGKTQITPRTSPQKPLVKKESENAEEDSLSRRGSLVAAYTTNSPSPTRSFKSTNSEKPTLPRNSPFIDRQQKLNKLSEISKVSGPGQASQGPASATTPLKLRQIAPTKFVAPLWKESPTKASAPFLAHLRPVRVSHEGPTSTAKTSSPAKQQTSKRDQFSVPCQSVNPSRDYSVTSSIEPRLQTQSLPTTSILAPAYSPIKELQEQTQRASLDSRSEAAHNNFYNSVQDQTSSLEVLQLPEQFSIARRFPGNISGLDGSTLQPARQDAIFFDLNNSGHSLFPHNDDSRNTKLNNIQRQMMPSQDSMHDRQRASLERQLASKAEEIQHLRNQLESREALDIDTLSDELRDAKREIGRWKKRAELAEKQLDILTQYSTGGESSIFRTGASSCTAHQINNYSTDFSLDSGRVDDKLRQYLHGGDGARSFAGWESEESTETIAKKGFEESLG